MPLLIKRGEPFLCQGHYTEDDGTTPKPLPGPILKSQLRTPDGKLVTNFAFTNVDVAAGTFTMELPEGADTSKWPLGKLYFDIKDANGFISEAEEINVGGAQTLS